MSGSAVVVATSTPDTGNNLRLTYLLDYDQEFLEALTRVQEIGGCMWMTQFWDSKPESQSAIAHCLKTIDQPNVPWLDF